MPTLAPLRSFAVALGVLLLAGTAQPLLAQTASTGGPTPQAPDPTQVPIDGGATLLLAGSVAYGLRKLRRRRG